MTEINPLIAVPSPRDIFQVKQAIDRIPADKLWIKYYTPEILAYDIMREEFLKHEEYTHLVILPDDLLVTLETWEDFIHDVEQYPRDIISGYCNLDRTFNSGYTNISPKLVHHRREGRVYTWFSMAGIKEEAKHYRIEHADKHIELPDYMIDVPFAGFPLFAVPRIAIDEIIFRNDSLNGRDPLGCCVDVTFCWDAIRLGYRILVDIRLRTDHLKINDGAVERFFAGVKEPYFEFDKIADPIKL